MNMENLQNNSGNMDDVRRKKESRIRSNANLEPYKIKKGEIRNPKGRGVGREILTWISKLAAPELLIEQMRLKFKLHRGKIDVEAAILLRLAYEACKGDLKAIELWLDRKYGKVSQPMDLSANNGPLVAILNAPAGDQNISVSTPAVKPAENLSPPEVKANSI